MIAKRPIANALWRSHHRPEQSHLQDQHRITAIFSDRTDFPIGTIELEAEKPLVYDSQGDVVEYRISQTGLQRPPRVSAGNDGLRNVRPQMDDSAADAYCNRLSAITGG